MTSSTALLLALVAAAGPTVPPAAEPHPLEALPAGPEASAPPENLLRGPARCVLRYLDAVRLAGPRAPEIRPARAVPVRPRDYDAARRLTAPRALTEVERREARGEVHPLAPWREAQRGEVLESFQLLAVRRAPRGAAVVTVRESFWSASGVDEALARLVSEYLVARVNGAWRVVDRRPGGTFGDGEVANGYAGWFDDPGAAPGAPAPPAAQDAAPEGPTP